MVPLPHHSAVILRYNHPMNAQILQELIAKHLPEAIVMVSGDDGAHFEALVVTTAFIGLSPVKQHQLVYQALGERMREEIHALALRTMTPEQWQTWQATHPS